MIETPSFPAIAPVPEGIHRPLWSVMIPTYNCAQYLEQTLKTVLAQDLGPEQMQIEVVDDCSTQDDPEAVVSALGRGRVSFYRQPQNGGAIHNFNTCIERSTGQIVHILHGDDLILPGFYKALESAFQQEPTLGAAFCRQAYIDEANQQRFLSPLEQETAGILDQLLQRIGVWCMIQTPSIVVKRSVYETIGGFHPDLFHAGDWEMWKRIAAHYPVWYEPQPLARYRTHTANHTSSLVKSGANIANTRQAIEISQSYLPSAVNHTLTHQAREFYALYAFETACWQLVRLDLRAAIAQLSEALKCSHSPKAIAQMIKFVLQVGIRRSQRGLSALTRPLQPS
jgi:glycosyltransferase involved in cell wall biosynthesis